MNVPRIFWFGKEVAESERHLYEKFLNVRCNAQLISPDLVAPEVFIAIVLKDQYTFPVELGLKSALATYKRGVLITDCTNRTQIPAAINDLDLEIICTDDIENALGETIRCCIYAQGN